MTDASAFEVGSRVQHIPTGATGVVLAVRRVAGGKTFLKVRLDDGELVAKAEQEWTAAEEEASKV